MAEMKVELKNWPAVSAYAGRVEERLEEMTERVDELALELRDALDQLKEAKERIRMLEEGGGGAMRARPPPPARPLSRSLTSARWARTRASCRTR